MLVTAGEILLHWNGFLAIKTFHRGRMKLTAPWIKIEHLQVLHLSDSTQAHPKLTGFEGIFGAYNHFVHCLP